MPLVEGDMGGLNGDGDIIVTDEGEPGKKFIPAKSTALVLEGPVRGDGTAEPVDTYKGRISSCVWAKKQTLLLQLVPSLQSRVLYCAG